MAGLLGLWWLDRSRKIQAEHDSLSAGADNLAENVEHSSSPSRQRRNKTISTRKEPESVALSSRGSISATRERVLSSESGDLEAASVSYEQEEEEPLLVTHSRTASDDLPSPSPLPSSQQLRERRLLVIAHSTSEVRRGNIFASMSICLIVLTWLLFLGTAFLKLRSKKERTGSPSFAM